MLVEAPRPLERAIPVVIRSHERSHGLILSHVAIPESLPIFVSCREEDTLV